MTGPGSDLLTYDKAEWRIDAPAGELVVTSIGERAHRANAASTGDKNVAIGRAYLGYGQDDKAVDQLSKGLSKGSVKNEADARLTLGIAQLKAGHKDDALKTFKAVKGDPALERLASLWGIHATQGTAVSQADKPKATKGKHPQKVARAH